MMSNYESKDNGMSLPQNVNEYLFKLNESYNLLNVHSKKTSFPKRIISKIFDKLIGWYINPRLGKQSEVNAIIVNLFQEMIPYLKSLESENTVLKNNINELEGTLKEHCNIYKDKISELEVDIKDFDILCKDKINEFEDAINRLKHEDYGPLLDYIKSRLNITSDLKLLQNSSIDYFDFENAYRGNRQKIKEYQGYFVQFYPALDQGYVLDIGCGRGEFMELLKEHGIAVKGIDSYQPFVDYCNGIGLDVEAEDALTYLSGLEDESLNGIFMSQVIEHLSTDYAIALIKMAYKKLKKESYFIIETPNPQNLSTYWNFYLDASHIKPVHYLTLEYWFKSFHYASVMKYHSEFSKCEFQLPKIESDDTINKEKINKCIDYINNRIFGYYDYSLIAKK